MLRKRNLTDQALVSSILSGNRKDFGILIEHTERLVGQIIFKMIRNPEDRKDMMQDVYIKVFSKLSTFKFNSKLSTWVAQISYHTCLNYLAKKKLMLLDPQAGQEDNPTFDSIDRLNISTTTEDAENWMYSKELGLIMEAEIENLPPLYKTLINLFHSQELSYIEIGEITKLPEGTIKNYLYRARKRLRESLLKSYNKEDL